LNVKLLAFAAGFVISLAMGELMLRFFPAFEPQPRSYVGDEADRPSANFLADREIGWRMRPRHEFVVDTAEYHVAYRSNAEGFRDERAADAPDAERSIALVGDSFAFGQGVPFEQTFGALLEAGLPGTRVYNLAMPGFGMDQIWRTVKAVALPLRPELVIVAYISEDFTRSFNAWRPDTGLNKPVFRLEDGALRPQTAADRPPALARFLERHSRLWAGARQAARLLAHRYGIGEWWQLNRAILDAIRADCREAGTRVVFVYLPTRELRTFPALRRYMLETRADFVDLGNQPITPPQALHFPQDGHPNPAGHRYVADALLAWIGRHTSAAR